MSNMQFIFLSLAYNHFDSTLANSLLYFMDLTTKPSQRLQSLVIAEHIIFQKKKGKE